MKQNILHVALNVDDTQQHGAGFNKNTGEVIDFERRPTVKGLLKIDPEDKAEVGKRDCVIWFTGSPALSGHKLRLSAL